MLPALSLAPLTLAAVLALSGIAKLPDPSATASMIRLLRLPTFLHGAWVPRALPVVELVTAALLLTPWRLTYAVGAASALALCLVFLVVVARAMTFDPRPTCSCFGRVGDHRISGRTLTRNALLVALAGVGVWIAAQGGSTGRLLADFSAGDVVWLLLAVALAAVATLVLGGTVPAPRAPRTPPAAPPPDEELDYVRRPIPQSVVVDADLEAHSLRSLVREQAQLLVLVNCWCGPTYEVLERLPRWRAQLPALGVGLVHTLVPWEEPRAAELGGLWWDPGAQAQHALGAGGSPTAVLLGADGLLAGGPVTGLEAVEGFVEEIVEELAAADAEDLIDEQRPASSETPA